MRGQADTRRAGDATVTIRPLSSRHADARLASQRAHQRTSTNAARVTRARRLRCEAAVRRHSALPAQRACAPGRRSGRAGSASDAHRRDRPAARARSTAFRLRAASMPGARPVRLLTRNTCVSTANVGSPNATLSTTLAVLRPTPGRASSASRDRGHAGRRDRSISRRQVSIRFLALLRYRPIVRMCSSTPSTPSASICARRGRDREQPSRGLVDADVGGLRRQQHGGQQFEHAGVLQFRDRLRVGLAQRREEGLDIDRRMELMSACAPGPASLPPRPRRASFAARPDRRSCWRLSRSASLALAIRGQALSFSRLVRARCARCGPRSVRGTRRPVPGSMPPSRLRPGVASSSEMQSTGQTGMHSSQPVQSGSITVCMSFGAPTMQSTGQALMHSVQPMHQASSITAIRRGPSCRCPDSAP